MRPAIQLFTLRDLDATLPELLARVGDTAFEGVEFAGLGDSNPDEIRAALDDADLDVAAAHVGIEDLEAAVDGGDDSGGDDSNGRDDSDPDDLIETYRRLDCERLVVPYLDESHFASEAAVADTADRLQGLADRLRDRGAALGYHNHDHEFAYVGGGPADGASAAEDGTPADGRWAFDALADATDFDLELDVGWATAAGRDPVDLLGALRGRVPVVHLKDVADGQPVELGDGDVDAPACVRAARDAGTEWLVYEHDDPDDAEASLEHGAEALADLLD